MSLSSLSIKLTVESDESHDFALVDARIDGVTAISEGDQWSVLDAVEVEIRGFLQGLAEQRHLTSSQHDFLARMSAADFAAAARSWDYDTKEWSFEQDCALSKQISYRAFFGGPSGPEPFLEIESYLLINPTTRAGRLLVRANEGADFQEFLVNADEYVATWEGANRELAPVREARRRSSGG